MITVGLPARACGSVDTSPCRHRQQKTEEGGRLSELAAPLGHPAIYLGAILAVERNVCGHARPPGGVYVSEPEWLGLALLAAVAH